MSESRPTPAILGCLAFSAAIALLAVAALVVSMPAVAVPFGPPGEALHLAPDPLGASFLLLACVVAPFRPALLAGSALAMLAGDGFALTAGIALAVLRPARWVEWGSVVCLIAAFAVLGSPGAEFAAIRASSTDAAYAAAVLVLTLLAATALLREHAILAAYLLIRILLDLCGTSGATWWCVPVLLIGSLVTFAAPLRSALQETPHGVLSPLSLFQPGLAIVAIGVALFARLVDLPALGSMALQAAWLALVCHALCRTLLLHVADSVVQSADTRRLALLGGLIHRMPQTAGCCLVGLFATAILPPGLGFGAAWLLLQSLLSAARASALGLQVVLLVTALLISAGMGFAAIAGVRLFASVFLGRLRTPRTAVAEEAPRPVRLCLGGLAAFTALLGLLPRLALLPAAGWLSASAGMVLRPSAEAPGYAPIVLAALLLIVGCAAFWTQQYWHAGEPRREALWADGFAAPPPWLPFGDPATQIGPRSFTGPLRRILASVPHPVLPTPRLTRWRDAVLTWLAPT